jgi:hypothetical protein
MSTQPNSQVGYADYTPEEIHAIVRRAHAERAKALRELLSWLFTRHKATAEKSKQPARIDAVACS